MSIPQEIIDEVRRRADIVEIVGGHVPLKRAGANYKGLCPFHKEKSPSFNVNPSMQIFRCFGCGEGGNVFSFLMKYENLTFPQAVDLLARRYGVEIPRNEEDRSKQDARERLYAATAAAADYYHQLLLKAGGDSPIGRYVASRGLTDEQVKTFKLGWSPEGWEELYRHLSRNGYSDAELESAGLAQKSSRGNYIDRFRGRLMFPITGPAGRVIAFGGRIVVDDEKAPKYLNSPETPIYHKSNVLYGYHEGAKAAREAGAFIVVEGYMDTLALHAAGLHNVCAVSGTSLTEEHGKMLSRVCDRVALLFDADRAGEEAMKKSAPALMGLGLVVAAVTLTGAKDPDEFLKVKGADALNEAVAKAPSFLTYVVDRILGAYDMADVDQRIEAVRRAIPYLAHASDRIERAGYVDYLATKSGMDRRAIEQELAGRRAAPPPADAPRARAPKKPLRATPRQRTERGMLRMLMAQPALLTTAAADLAAVDFIDPLFQKVFITIAKGVEAGATEAADLINYAEDEETGRECASISGERHLFDSENTEGAVEDYLKKLRFDPEIKKAAKAELVAAEGAGDNERLRRAKERWAALMDQRR